MQGKAKSGIKSGSIEITIIKKDGTVINVGTVAAYHKNPLVNALLQIQLAYKRFNRWLTSLRTVEKV